MDTITLPRNCMDRFYFVIEMPLNKDGMGPASYDELETMTYEVWDQFCTTLGSFKALSDAINFCEELNETWFKDNK